MYSCATVVGSKNGILSFVLGVVHKKKYERIMNDIGDFMRIIWNLRDQITGFHIFKKILVQCAVSHHHGARRSSNRNSFTFFRLHCLYVLTRWRAGLCMGSILAEFLAGHIHNWLKSMALKTPSTKRYIGEIKCNIGSSYPILANHNIGNFFTG